MEFDWNPAKCAKNIAERGIDFADVVVAFGDPTKKVARDERNDYGEEPFQHARQSQRPGLPSYLHRARQGYVDNLRTKSKPTGAAAL